jgi:hypothetical protein
MDAIPQSSGKRPKLVWVVFLFSLFSSGYTALAFILIYSGSIHVTPEQAAYFRNLSALDYTMSLVTALLNLAGAVCLFLLRKVAFHLFIAALGLVTLQTLVHAATTSFIAALGGSGVVGGLFGYVTLIAVCVYAWKLKARGLLV